MKIVVDENVPLATALFGSHAELTFVNGRDIPPQALHEAKALICRSVTGVNASLLENTSVEFVGSCTIGTDHLDTKYLDDRGICWAHAPGCNAQSVVEYVTSALAALNALKPGKSASVIGCGSVGSSVYSELETLGMSLAGYDPFLAHDPDFSSSMKFTSLEDAMAADIVCIHTPYTTSGLFPTERMIGEAELSMLNEGAVLLSAGRGGVVCEEAMLAISEQRTDIQWVMDVWEREPTINPRTLELASIATPHVAGYSREGRENGSKQIYKKFCEHFEFVETKKLEEKVLFDLATAKNSVSEWLLGVYDPRQDDRRMRSAAVTSTNIDLASGGWFDRLRKEYPERRERSVYRIKQDNISSELLELAAALGFVIEI